MWHRGPVGGRRFGFAFHPFFDFAFHGPFFAGGFRMRRARYREALESYKKELEEEIKAVQEELEALSREGEKA